MNDGKSLQIYCYACFGTFTIVSTIKVNMHEIMTITYKKFKLIMLRTQITGQNGDVMIAPT